MTRTLYNIDTLAYHVIERAVKDAACQQSRSPNTTRRKARALKVMRAKEALEWLLSSEAEPWASVAGLEEGTLGRLGYRAVIKGRYDPGKIVEQIQRKNGTATESEQVFLRLVSE
jgi:hypothetical protein